MTTDDLLRNFRTRILECEKHLQDLETGRFRLYERAADGRDVDLNDRQKELWRNVIADYKSAIEHLSTKGPRGLVD